MWKVLWSIVVIVCAAIFIGYFAGMGLLYLAFSGMVYFIPLLLTLYIFILALLTFNLFRWMENRTVKKVFYGVSIVLFVVASGFAVPSLYKKTLDKVDAEVDLYAYAPFEKGTKAVTLDTPATLKLDENLPILDGATALYPVYSAFAQAVYPEREYELFSSEVMSNNTGEAYKMLLNGDVDIIFVAGPSEAQLKMAKGAGKEFNMTPIGKESFVFFVNAKNKVKGLTVDEIKGIYSGEITNWKEIGGKKKDIRAFQRPENSGSQTALQNLMGETPIMNPPVENVVGLMGGIIDQVSTYQNYNNAIGFTFRYYSTGMVGNNKIRLLEVNGVEPTVETIRSGDYPITAEFYAVTAGSENPHIDELLDWILSEQGQEIIEKTGYVSIE